VPKLAGSWRYDAAKKQVVVTVTQTVAGDLFRLPLEIGLVATPGAPPRIEKVELTSASATFSLSADVEPSAVVLDPNTWLLFEGERGPLKKG
jgi:hypothetical protein